MAKCTFVKNFGIGNPRDSRIQSPSHSCATQIGTCVKMLDTQQPAIANGTFARDLIAINAAATIWNGIAIIEKKNPIASPEATVSRQGTHSCLSNKRLVTLRHHSQFRSRRCRSIR